MNKMIEKNNENDDIKKEMIEKKIKIISE